MRDSLREAQGAELLLAFEETKKCAHEAADKCLKKLENKKQAQGKALKDCISFLSKTLEEGSLSAEGREALRELKREKVVYEAERMALKTKKGKQICIQTGRKSNKTFFRKIAFKRKEIKNMSLNDERDEKAERTNNQSAIIANFTKTYKKTYAKKVIDEPLLKELCEKMKITLLAKHKELLGGKITSEEVLKVLEGLKSGVSPGLDGVVYEMYNVKPGITARALAAIGNWMMESEGVTHFRDEGDNIV